MDRLLQFSLDRAYGNDVRLKQAIVTALAFTVDDIEAGFVDGPTLERWRQVSTEVAARAMDWDRMRGMISNHLRMVGLGEGETLTNFLDSLPDLLDETIAHVTSEEVDAFVQRSLEAARGAVARYLGCE
jgi:hypothetical protein